MPLALTFTEGALREDAEKEAGRRITDAFLKRHDLRGNSDMIPVVTSHSDVLPKNSILSGGESILGARIGAKSPSFALSFPEVQLGCFEEATEIVEESSGGKLPREHSHSNAIHTVDGTWNMDGRTLTNEQLGEAIANG